MEGSKKYKQIVIDSDGISHIEMLPGVLYSTSDLVALVHVMFWYERKNEGENNYGTPGTEEHNHAG